MTLADRLARADAESAQPTFRATGLRNIASEQPRSDKEAVKGKVHSELIESLGQQLYGDQLDRATLEKHVFDATTKVLDEFRSEEHTS